MAQDFKKAARQFVESDFFRRGVLAFEFSEIEEELIKFIEAYHVALAIQSVRVYSQNRLCTDQVIKPALRNMTHAKCEYYPKIWKSVKNG